MNDSATRERLRRLIGGFDPTEARRANQFIADRLSTCTNLMIFGAGQNGRLVQGALRLAGLEPSAFIDETPAKIGSNIDGTPVIGLDDASGRPDAIVVCSIF